MERRRVTRLRALPSSLPLEHRSQSHVRASLCNGALVALLASSAGLACSAKTHSIVDAGIADAGSGSVGSSPESDAASMDALDSSIRSSDGGAPTSTDAGPDASLHVDLDTCLPIEEDWWQFVEDHAQCESDRDCAIFEDAVYTDVEDLNCEGGRGLLAALNKSALAAAQRYAALSAACEDRLLPHINDIQSDEAFLFDTLRCDSGRCMFDRPSCIAPPEEDTPDTGVHQPLDAGELRDSGNDR